MKKFLKRIIVFAITSLVISNFLKSLFPSHYSWGNEAFQEKVNYVAGDQSINSFYFGSSRVYRHLNPEIIDSVYNNNNNYKIKSFNMGAPATFAPHSYYLYENFLSSEASEPMQLAIIELSDIHPAGLKNLSSDKNVYWQNFNDLSFIFSSMYRNQEYSLTRRLANIGTYTVSFVQKPFQFKQYRGLVIPKNKPVARTLGPKKNGFHSLDFELKSTSEQSTKNNLIRRKTSVDKLTLLTEINKLKTIYGKQNVLDSTQYKRAFKLIQLSEEKGVKLIYFFSPRKVSANLVALYEALPKNNKLTLANPQEYPLLYHEDYSFDWLHLNEMGANELSLQLGLKLKSLFLKKQD
ncbi:hypothetical protein N9906_03780 [Flavobacteriaceae bacterium]|nr:hypothetical protein [Flavobacteriaceae bacterium]